MAETEYDVIVVGGGTAGSNAARASAKAGAKTALVRLPDTWNTCVQEGCMPSKSILASSHQGRNFEETMEVKDAHVDRLEKALNKMLQSESFDIIEGSASFNGEELSVENVPYRARRYVIATGSTSFIPPIAGLDSLSKDRVLTSQDIVSREHIETTPTSLIVVGGGPIGLELATFFSNLGTKVSIIERGPFLGRLDPEFGRELKNILCAHELITSVDATTVTSLEECNDGVLAKLDNGDVCIGEMVLFATGRKPNIESLNLESLGVVVEKGRVRHDPTTLQTDNELVYVAGDVTGTHQILHYAAAMGKVAGHNAAVGDDEKHINYDDLALGIIFSDPPVANIGLTEKEAREKGVDAVSSIVKYPEIGRGILESNTHGLWKLTANKKDGTIVGSQIIGARADDLIHVVASIMYFRGTVQDAQQMLWYHPTYPEFLQSLARDLCKKLSMPENDSVTPGI